MPDARPHQCLAPRPSRHPARRARRARRRPRAADQPLEPPRQQVEEDMLALEQPVARLIEPEPFGAIDLREALSPPALRRPLDFEAVAADRRAIDMPLAGKD